MSSLLRVLFLLPALVFVGGLAALILHAKAQPRVQNTNPPQTLVIGVDLSTSNPLVHDDAFAAKVGARIAPMIESLAPRSRIMLRSFGAYNSSANLPLTLDITIAPKTARADEMAKFLSTIIAGVPKMVREGRLQAQMSTNIVPFLQNTSRTIDCRAMPTHVILATDGVEDSQVARLKRRSSTLPPPQGAYYAGCEELLILGLGRGLNSPSDTERLRAEWTLWAQRAGFRRFGGLNDW